MPGAVATRNDVDVRRAFDRQRGGAAGIDEAVLDAGLVGAGARGFGQESRASGRSDENREIVSRRLRAGRSIDGFLQTASPEWEYDSRRLPNGPDQSVCTARCRRAGRNSLPGLCLCYMLGTSWS